LRDDFAGGLTGKNLLYHGESLEAKFDGIVPTGTGFGSAMADGLLEGQLEPKKDDMFRM